jgi:murein DD-endopeptidase MepM/ murein hydrolase activator NlpD
MYDYPNRLLDKLSLLFVIMLIAISPLLLLFLISSIGATSVQASGANSSNVANYGSNNAVKNGVGKASVEFNQTMNSAAVTANNSLQSFASATTQTGKVVARTTKTVFTSAIRGVGSGLLLIGRTTGKATMFIIGIPGNVIGFVSNTNMVNSVLRPSDYAEVPIIDPNSPELLAAINALPPTDETNGETRQGNLRPAWPINGVVTTEFGVPHWPYQRTHTGMDISDAQPSGITPIKPFRPGKVIDSIHSRYGLGNNVVVDHGNGVTSVYGHLAAISVKVGQDVNLGTTLGYEGSTGVSTGTHLHFEIRVNGLAANPRQFINGQP